MPKEDFKREVTTRCTTRKQSMSAEFTTRGTANCTSNSSRNFDAWRYTYYIFLTSSDLPTVQMPRDDLSLLPSRTGLGFVCSRGALGARGREPVILRLALSKGLVLKLGHFSRNGRGQFLVRPLRYLSGDQMRSLAGLKS